MRAGLRQDVLWLERLQIHHRQLDRVNGVFHQQAEFGVALHGQAAVEKQRVGVFLAARQLDEIMRAGADGEIGRARVLAGDKTAVAPFKVKGPMGVQHTQAQFFADQHVGHVGIELFGQCQVQGRDKQHRPWQTRQPPEQLPDGLRDQPCFFAHQRLL